MYIDNKKTKANSMKNNTLKIFLVGFLLLSISGNDIAQVLTYPIVDTGVKEYYNNSTIISAPLMGQVFFGQDANYSGNQPSYTDNGDGTITDNITGLMWQKDMERKI